MSGFSYSQLSAALKCNRLYQYLYVDKLKPEQEDSIDLHFGTALHTGINALLEGGDASSFGIYWESVREKPLPKGRFTWLELAEMGDVFLDRFARLHLKHLKPLIAERRLYATTPNDVILEGTPDFIGSYKGALTVLDFKTAGSRYVDGKLEASDQLLLYSYLAQVELQKEIEQIAYIVFVKGKEPSIQTQIMPLSQDVLKARILNIEHQCKELKEKQFFTQNFNACLQGNRCPFWKQCHGKDEK